MQDHVRRFQLPEKPRRLLVGGMRGGGTDVNFHATPEMVPGTRHGRHQDLPGSGIYPAPMFQKRCERGIGRSKSRRQRPQQSHHSRH